MTKLGDRVQEIHLLDIGQGFLDVAKEYLADLKSDAVTHVFDFNAPDDYPNIAPTERNNSGENAQ